MQFEQLARTQILLCGIEAHICIYQTAMDLWLNGFHVEVVVDAISSRTEDSRALAVERMTSQGIGGTNVEMALFELLKSADHPLFRSLSKLIK